MRAADYIVDIGPGAGEHGGKYCCSRLIEEIKKCERFNNWSIFNRKERR